MTSTPTVLFAPASGPGVGGGHVMRDGALATALAGRGCACVFALGPEGAAILDRFYPGAFATVTTGRGDADALSHVADRSQARVLVIDDYTVDAAVERRLASTGRVVAVVDDLADRPHACDLLFDPGPGRLASDYARLSPGAQVRVGPSYAFLRPAFAVEPDRRIATRIDRLFVSFGLSDVGEVAARAVGLARGADPSLVFDVALSASAPSRGSLEGVPGVTLHLDSPDVPRLMKRADAALGAGGSGAWERAAMGLPTLAVVVADNQRPAVDALVRAGATLACDLHAPGFEAAFLESLSRLADPNLRRTLSERSRALCDGRGAERAAEAILEALKARS